MSENSSLTELARFVGQSEALRGAYDGRRVDGLGAFIAAVRDPRRRVLEILAAVHALSGRAQRMPLPRVSIELDVFTPQGGRAARLLMPR